MLGQMGTGLGKRFLKNDSMDFLLAESCYFIVLGI